MKSTLQIDSPDVDVWGELRVKRDTNQKEKSAYELPLKLWLRTRPYISCDSLLFRSKNNADNGAWYR